MDMCTGTGEPRDTWTCELSSHDLPSHNDSRNAYFFDNPRRYDSDEDLNIRTEITNSFPTINRTDYSVNDESDGTPPGSLTGTPSRPQRLGYGAVMSSHTGSPIIYSPSQAGYLYRD